MPVEKFEDKIRIRADIPATNKATEAARVLREGQLPSNAALHSVIDAAETTLEQQQTTEPLSAKGHLIAEHTKDLLQTTSRAIDERNADEKIQKLVEQTAEAGQEIAPDWTTSSAPTRRMQAQATNSKVAISAVARLLVRSSEFRGALTDVLDILQDIFIREQPGEAGVAEPLRQKGNMELNQKPGRQYQSWSSAANFTTENIKNVGIALTKDSNEEAGWTIPEDKKNELIDQIRNVLMILMQDAEFKTGTRNIVALIENVSKTATRAAREIEQRAEVSKQTDEVEQTAKQVVEEFTGHKSVDPFLNMARDLIAKIRNDKRLEAWVHQLKRMVHQVLDSPAELDNQSWRDQVSELVDRARDLAHRYNYDSDWQNLNKEGRELLEAFKNDSLLNELEQKGKVLASDIVYVDDHNNVHVDFESLGEVRKIVMPLILDQLKSVPVPRIQFSDESYDGILDNVVLSIRDIAPDHIHIRTISDTDIRLDQLESTTDSEIRLSMGGMRTHLGNVKFYFNHKSFPKIEDSGTVDCNLGGEGAKLEIVLAVERKEGHPITFRGSDITFDLSELSLKFREDVSHPVLLKLWATYMRKNLTLRAEELVKERVTAVVNDITVQLNSLMKQVYNNMQRRLEEDKAQVEKHAKEVAATSTCPSSTAPLSTSAIPTQLGSHQMQFGQFGTTGEAQHGEAQHHFKEMPSMF
jgi:hypothetical protein